MLHMHFRYVRFLENASGVSYLPYRQGYKLLENKDWVTLVVVDDFYNRDTGMWGYSNPALGKELESFYNQCFIEVGKFTKPHNGAVIHRDMTGYLHRDNHDGFTFKVSTLGNFMIISHDGTMQLYMQTNQHRVLITKEALDLIAAVAY